MSKTITIYFINHQIFSLNLSLFKFSDENFPLDWNSQNEPKTAAFYFQKWVLQLRTHQWIQSTSYVCTGRIFHKLLRTLNKVLLENFSQRNIALIFTLLLTPFESKLANKLRHSESLNIRKNSEIDDIFLWRQLIVDFQTYFKDSLCLE